jgi:hypothetical protein
MLSQKKVWLTTWAALLKVAAGDPLFHDFIMISTTSMPVHVGALDLTVQVVHVRRMVLPVVNFQGFLAHDGLEAARPMVRAESEWGTWTGS